MRVRSFREIRRHCCTACLPVRSFDLASLSRSPRLRSSMCCRPSLLINADLVSSPPPHTDIEFSSAQAVHKLVLVLLAPAARPCAGAGLRPLWRFRPRHLWVQLASCWEEGGEYQFDSSIRSTRSALPCLVVAGTLHAASIYCRSSSMEGMSWRSTQTDQRASKPKASHSHAPTAANPVSFSLTSLFSSPSFPEEKESKASAPAGPVHSHHSSSVAVGARCRGHGHGHGGSSEVHSFVHSSPSLRAHTPAHASALAVYGRTCSAAGAGRSPELQWHTVLVCYSLEAVAAGAFRSSAMIRGSLQPHGAPPGADGMHGVLSSASVARSGGARWLVVVGDSALVRGEDSAP